jgi:putative FmdB family regulatory protein
VPLYEYECAECGKRFEKIEKLSAPRKQQCPQCGNRAERQLSAPGFQFKGSGWYVTDYSGKGKPPADHAEASKPEAKEGKETKETKETKEARKEPAAKETKKGKK